MIEFNYHLVKKYTIKFTFFPYLVQIIIYVFYFDFVGTYYIGTYDPNQAIAIEHRFINLVFLLTLGYFAFYFVRNEFS